jgi:5-methyltetrahydropteroyltriglutamate--homocysteine methyltransferase
MNIAVKNARPDLKTLRVDQVGSFLRPDYLKRAFADFEGGRITAEQLRETQDRAIRKVVEDQLAHGLPVVNDGEFRRTVFNQSFSTVAGLEQVSQRSLPVGPTERPKEGYSPVPARARRPTQKLELLHNDLLTDYKFVRGLTDAPGKVTIIGVDRVVHGYGDPQPGDVYPSLDAFVDDLARVQSEIIAGLAAAGCRYVNFDEPSLTGYVDPKTLEELKANGEDPKVNLARAIRADNLAIAGHDDVVFGVHICRGNRQSLWHREGHYDGIAEQLFNELNFDRFLLEYDTERAGGFEPLRFVPKGKIVVLGIITTKSGELEDADFLVRRIEEASRFIPIEQLALSPQCGFASVLAGNFLSEDEQWRKIDRMVEVADRVWGRG